MDTGDLFAGLNALDAVRVRRDPGGNFVTLISDSEDIPVTTINNHDAQHVILGLASQIADAVFASVYPLPARLSGPTPRPVQ